MTKKIKVGIVGFGKMGKIRMDAINNNPHLTLEAICDVKPIETNLSNKYDFFQNYEDLLNIELDAVFISTPNLYSPKIAVTFLNNNKHIFCEKPPGRNLSDVQQILDVKQIKKGLKVKFGFNHRYHNAVMEAKKIVNSGRLGKILCLKGFYGKSGGIDFKNGWRSDKEIAGGGILLDQGIHMLDLFRMFCGDFQEVKSFVANMFWNIEMEDNAFALLRNSKNQIAILHSSATQWKHTFRLEIFLEDGYLIIPGLITSTRSYGQEHLIVAQKQFENESFAIGNPKEEVIYFDKDRSWELEIQDFVECIKYNKEVVEGSIEDALKAMELVFKIYHADSKWRNKMR